VNGIRFDVHGVVKGQPRAKAFRRGSHAGVYNPPTADVWKAAVRGAAMHAWNKVTLNGPLEVSICAVFERPKSHFRKDGSLKSSAPKHWQHTSKPDVDNIAKAILDELSTPDPVTGLSIMKGDACVMVLYVEKSWSNDNFFGARISVHEYADLHEDFRKPKTTIETIAEQIV